jgi:hypothetical protein
MQFVSYRIRWGTIIWILSLVVLCASAALGISTPQDKPLPQNNNYALVIIVSAMKSNTPADVLIAFPTEVPEADLRGQILDLSKRTGWRVGEPKITYEPMPGLGKQTQASFACEGIVDAARGWLGIEPLVDEFSPKGPFKVAFLVSPEMSFPNAKGFNKGEFAVKLSVSPGAYQYDVSLLNPSPGVPQGDVFAARHQHARVILLFLCVLLFVLVAFVVVAWWLWYGKKRGESATDGRPHDETSVGGAKARLAKNLHSNSPKKGAASSGGMKNGH